MAFIALAASILAKVDPADIILRAVIAYVTGLVMTQLWYIFFTIRVQRTPVGVDSSIPVNVPQSVEMEESTPAAA